MKSAIARLLMMLLLSGCSAAPFKADKQVLTALAPDVPVIPKKVQAQAAAEMKSGVAPAENQIINACLLTRDEARAEAGHR